MDTSLVPHVIVETPAYLRAVAPFWDADMQVAFKNYIGLNYMAGDVIPGTGGIRKIRWTGSGHGKRGGVRVIYYYYNDNHPIYLLFAYAKNAQDDLTGKEKFLLKSAVQKLKKSLQEKEKR